MLLGPWLFCYFAIEFHPSTSNVVGKLVHLKSTVSTVVDPAGGQAGHALLRTTFVAPLAPNKIKFPLFFASLHLAYYFCRILLIFIVHITSFCGHLTYKKHYEKL